MKVKPFVLAGAVGTMALAGTASAAFLGLKCEVWVGEGWVENGYAGLTTYRLWANFDSTDEGVLAVFGITDVPLSANSTDGFFYNDVAFGGEKAPLDLRAGGIWSNQWDSYVTINATSTRWFDDPDATGLSPGFAGEVNSLASDWATENAAWFVTPDDPQFAAREKPDGGLGVFIAQFTVAEGEGIFGTANLLLSDGSEVRGLEFATGTPAPGALALLGVAGLAGSRRRRR